MIKCPDDIFMVVRLFTCLSMCLGQDNDVDKGILGDFGLTRIFGSRSVIVCLIISSSSCDGSSITPMTSTPWSKSWNPTLPKSFIPSNAIPCICLFACNFAIRTVRNLSAFGAFTMFFRRIKRSRVASNGAPAKNVLTASVNFSLASMTWQVSLEASWAKILIPKNFLPSVFPTIGIFSCFVESWGCRTHECRIEFDTQASMCSEASAMEHHRIWQIGHTNFFSGFFSWSKAMAKRVRYQWQMPSSDLILYV